MKYQIAILALWVIAGITTLLLTNDSHLLTTLGPLYTICMIGSILTVRAALRSANERAA